MSRMVKAEDLEPGDRLADGHVLLEVWVAPSGWVTVALDDGRIRNFGLGQHVEVVDDDE